MSDAPLKPGTDTTDGNPYFVLGMVAALLRRAREECDGATRSPVKEAIVSAQEVIYNFMEKEYHRTKPPDRN